MQVKIILLLSFLITFPSFGQRLLFHKNNFKEAIYQTGDVISFKLKNSRTKITRQIVGFEDSVIVFQDYRINPKEISAIYVDKKTITWFILRYKYRNVFPMIGVGYFLVDWANSGEVTQNTAFFSTSFLAAGILARILIPNYIKLTGRKRLVILK